MSASVSPATTAAAASPTGWRSIIPAGSNKLATLDIVPTWAMWHDMDARLAIARLALDVPRAAGAVSRDADRQGPDLLFRHPSGGRHQVKSLAAFDPRALAHYHAFFNDPMRVHATCEDYRAGRTTDLAHDEADRAAGKKITCPMLRSGGRGRHSERRPRVRSRPGANGRTTCAGFAIDCGHYLAEEAPRRPPGRCSTSSPAAKRVTEKPRSAPKLAA